MKLVVATLVVYQFSGWHLHTVFTCKWALPDLPHSNSNLPNSHTPSRSIQCIHLLQTTTPALLLHLHFPCLPRSSSLPISLHFKLQCFSKHAHHPSKKHARTISLHLPLPSEPLFPQFSIIFVLAHNYNYSSNPYPNSYSNSDKYADLSTLTH